MPSLAELQRDFGACLRDEARPAPASVAGGTFLPAARLQVYRNNVEQSLRRALAACYPTVLALVGEGFFAWLAHEYRLAHPSRSGNLHDYGARLADFVAGFEAAASHPWLVDVARLEWARQEAYHAAFHPPLDLTALAAVPAEEQESLRLRLHPACRLVTSRWPVLTILDAHAGCADQVPAVDLDAGGEAVLVARADLAVTCTRLSAGGHALLAALAAGETLGTACEQALAAQPDLDLGACVQALVLDRVLVAFERPR